VPAQLLRHGEILPGLAAEEFAARREALADAMPADSVALLPAPPLKHRAGVVPYPYRAVGVQLPCSSRCRAAEEWGAPRGCMCRLGSLTPFGIMQPIFVTPQEADIMYLTGVRQPGILAAISSARGSGKGAFTLFVPDASQAAAQWDGALLNNAAAEEVFGANAAFPMSQVSSKSRLSCIVRACSGPVHDAQQQTASI
jgi:Aminopeptidase P, N-terminal domain